MVQVHVGVCQDSVAEGVNREMGWRAKQAKNMRKGKPCATREEFVRVAEKLDFDPTAFVDC